MSRISDKTFGRILFCIGILLFVSEIWKQFTLNLILVPAGTFYDWWYFPFQLCSTPMYVCLLMPLSEKIEGFRDALLTYLATFGLIAGIFTFFDISGFSQHGYLPLSVHSWVWHILQILMGIFCFGRLAVKERGNFVGAAGIFLAGCLIAEVLNITAGRHALINMFYISPLLKMNQPFFKDIAGYIGNGWGIITYILSIMVGAAAVYIAIITVSGLRSRSQKN